MRLNCCATALLAALGVTATAEPLTSYHIGNSLTNDMQPYGVAAMANEHGFNASAGQHIHNSASLATIWNNPAGASGARPFPDPAAYDVALPDYTWDAVTLQPHSSQGSTLGQDEEMILNFIDLTRTRPANVDTRFYIYATWPSQNLGAYQSVWTQDIADEDDTRTVQSRQYYTHLIERVRARTDATVLMIPAGEVLYELDRRFRDSAVPEADDVTDLYRDQLHLRDESGRFVAGLTTYATLYGADPFGVEKPEGHYVDQIELSPDFYRVVQDTVDDVVQRHPYTTVPEPATLVYAILVFPWILRRWQR